MAESATLESSQFTDISPGDSISQVLGASKVSSATNNTGTFHKRERQLTSPVWNWISHNSGLCRVCNETIDVSDKKIAVINARRHLDAHTKSGLLNSDELVSKKFKSERHVQKPITSYMQKKVPDYGSATLATIGHHLSFFFLTSTTAFRACLENPHFRRVIDLLSAGKYKLPDRHTISKNILNLDAYYRVYLRDFLSLCTQRRLCLSFAGDGWTDHQSMHWHALVGFCVNPVDFSTCRIVLGMCQWPVTQSGENNCAFYSGLLEQFGCCGYAFTTDGDAAERKAVQIYLNLADTRERLTPRVGPWIARLNLGSRVYCICHELHLIALDGIGMDGDRPKYSADVFLEFEPVRRLVHVLTHTKLNIPFREACEEADDIHFWTLTKDVKTRWTSFRRMLKRLVDARQQIEMSLTSDMADDVEGAQDLMLSEAKWTLIKECLLLMDPLYFVSNTLEGDKYPTLNLVWPMMVEAEKVVMSINNLTTTGARKVKKILLQQFKARFFESPAFLLICYDIASLLDIRYFKFDFFAIDHKADLERPTVQRKKVIKALITLMKDLEFINNRDNEQNVIAINEEKKEDVDADANVRVITNPLLVGLQNYTDDQQEVHAHPADKYQKEINRYFEEAKRASRLLQSKGVDAFTSFNPLMNFWFHHREDFPLLTPVALLILAIQASSASAEREFSKAAAYFGKTRILIL